MKTIHAATGSGPGLSGSAEDGSGLLLVDVVVDAAVGVDTSPFGSLVTVGGWAVHRKW